MTGDEKKSFGHSPVSRIVSDSAAKTQKRHAWNQDSVRSLRRHLGLTQREMAEELGTRQQTISEWETGMYRPRGVSATLLTIIAEKAAFEYASRSEEDGE